MLDEKNYEFCDEFYLVEKTVEVVLDIAGQSQSIRIEAKVALPSGIYSTSAYRQEHISAQPTYPQSNGKFDRTPTDMSIWVPYDLPWTSGSSADEVLRRALSFLRERSDRKGSGA